MQRLKLDYKIHGIKNASEKEKEFYVMSVKLMTKVLNQPFFWIDLSDKWHDLEEKNGVTFSNYKRMILSGADNFNKQKDGVVDIMVHLYSSFRNVIGYTYPSTWYTWFNRKYINRFDYGEMAGHIYHENLGHNLGFGHVNGNRNSLVYQSGYLMRDHVRAYLKGLNKPLKHKEVIKRKPWYKRFWNSIKRIF